MSRRLTLVVWSKEYEDIVLAYDDDYFINIGFPSAMAMEGPQHDASTVAFWRVRGWAHVHEVPR
jgi:hypothetical protein